MWLRSSRLSQIWAPPTSAREPLGQVDRRRAADEVAGQRVALVVERGVGEGVVDGGLELVERRHHGLGHVAPAELAEAPEAVGQVGADHRAASLAAFTKALMRSWSLTPGADSVPRTPSTAHGRAARMASATFAASSAPASSTRRSAPSSRASAQCSRSSSGVGAASKWRSSRIVAPYSSPSFGSRCALMAREPNDSTTSRRLAAVQLHVVERQLVGDRRDGGGVGVDEHADAADAVGHLGGELGGRGAA